MLNSGLQEEKNNTEEFKKLDSSRDVNPKSLSENDFVEKSNLSEEWSGKNIVNIKSRTILNVLLYFPFK